MIKNYEQDDIPVISFRSDYFSVTSTACSDCTASYVIFVALKGNSAVDELRGIAGWLSLGAVLPSFVSRSV